MQEHTVTIEPGGEGAASRLVFAPRFNAAAAFVDRHLAEGRGAKAAIRTAEGDVTYAELAERVARCGNALKVLGIAPGARVLLAVLDRPEFFYLFWGAIKAGMVPVPLNTLLRADDYRYMIADSEAELVVYSPELAAELAPAIAAARPRLAMDTGELLARLADASPVLAPAPTGPLDDGFWLYTSGSTGRPKGAVHRQRDLVVSAQHYGVETLGAREDDVFYSAAKLFFAYGLGNALAFPLWVGGTAVLVAERPTAASTFEAIRRFRPSLFFGVPTLFARQIAEFAGLGADLSSVRRCTSAGEALPAHLYAAWHQLTGTEILDGIGSTEAAHVYISNRPGAVVPGSSGRPVPGYRARIVGENGAELPAGEAGRLMLAGDSIARCYWRNPKPTLVDGWFDTGDTYRVDADGIYTYSGRSDDMLKVGGIWCSPVEIEAALIEHPAVLEAAVVGRADADGLIKPEAWIVPKGPGAEALAEALVRHCKSRLAPYKYPRWVRIVDDLPKTATGKIQRFRLRVDETEARAEG
ncbi:MAG: benzoate-CoA ligase family protein [Rhodospirillales bacterium]|nr:benzoate-CoA ligase family protein [Rhodospirillales bacterium]